MNTLFSYDYENFESLKTISPFVKSVVCRIDSWCLVEAARLTFYGKLGASVGGAAKSEAPSPEREVQVPDGFQETTFTHLQRKSRTCITVLMELQEV